MLRLASVLLIAGGLATGAARASDLGTAGPFRSVGGAACAPGTPDHCDPPAVDPSLSRGAQVSAHVARALALLDLVRASDARKELDSALALDAENLRALTLRGRLAQSNGDIPNARIDIDHALLLAPDDPDLLATRGSLASTLCECDQGLKDLGIALDKKPNDIDALFIRARLYLQFRDTARAFTDLTTLLSVSPEDVRARLLRAGIQLTRKDYDLATLDANAVLAMEPMNNTALLFLAKARAGAGDDEAAIASYTVLLDQAGARNALFVPDYREAMLDRARLYARQSRKDDAARDLGAVIEQGGPKAILRLQLFLRSNGFPNVEISGSRSTAFDTALASCFADKVCGPNLKL